MTVEEKTTEELEEERDFLLRSLDDLDNELVAGNIDPDSYRKLHDDYTARASAIIRSLDDGVARPSPREPNLPRVMKIVTVGGIVVFCVLIAFLITKSSGERKPGQTVTGNSQVTGNTVDPNSYDALIAQARASANNQQIATAIQQFTDASRLAPTQPEPFASRGALTYSAAQLVSDKSTQAQLVARALADLNQAIKLDAKYAPAYAYRGELFYGEGEFARAVPDLQRYLVLIPTDDPSRAAVLDVLNKATAAEKKP